MKIYIVRHGESYSNTQGRIVSTTDLPLTERGIKQAEAVRKYLERIVNGDFHHIYTSPLIRAKQTMEIICGNNINHQNVIDICGELVEMNLGKMEGLTWGESAELYPDIDTAGGLSNAHMPDGERFEDVVERCDHFIQYKLLPLNSMGNVLIVSHGITIRVLINCLLGKAGFNVNYINWPDNTAISQIDVHPETGAKTLIRLNDRVHLAESDLGAVKYDEWGIFAKEEYKGI